MDQMYNQMHKKLETNSNRGYTRKEKIKYFLNNICVHKIFLIIFLKSVCCLLILGIFEVNVNTID